MRKTEVVERAASGRAVWTNSPKMMPLGWAGGCHMRRTDEVLTSGNRMPIGGPGTVMDEKEENTQLPSAL